MAYGGCQKLVAKAAGVPRTEDLSVLHNGLSGFLAAFWSSLALCPTELVKCRYLYRSRLFEFKAVFRIHIHLIRIRPKSESESYFNISLQKKTIERYTYIVLKSKNLCGDLTFKILLRPWIRIRNADLKGSATHFSTNILYTWYLNLWCTFGGQNEAKRRLLYSIMWVALIYYCIKESWPQGLQWGGIIYIFLYYLCPRLQAMRESFTAAGQLPPRLGPVQLTKGMRGRKVGLEILRVKLHDCGSHVEERVYRYFFNDDLWH